MSTSAFFNERNCQLILDVCNGQTVKAASVIAGISRSRCDQILAKVRRILQGNVQWINTRLANREGYHILGILYNENSAGTLGGYFAHNAWAYKLLLSYLAPDRSSIDAGALYAALKVHQEAELMRITAEWRAITHAVCWGTSLEDAAKTFGMTQYEVAKIVHLTCYSIDPQLHPDIYRYYRPYEIDYFQAHKRAFFDPIELDVSHLRYAPILNYLNEGEVPQKPTPSYMQALFERKYSNIRIAFSLEYRKKPGELELHTNVERHGHAANEFVAAFNNGPQEAIDYREDLVYVFVALDFDGFKYFSNFDNAGWVDLLLSLTTFLSTPQVEEQLKQVAA